MQIFIPGAFQFYEVSCPNHSLGKKMDFSIIRKLGCINGYKSLPMGFKDTYIAIIL